MESIKKAHREAGFRIVSHIRLVAKIKPTGLRFIHFNTTPLIFRAIERAYGISGTCGSHFNQTKPARMTILTILDYTGRNNRSILIKKNVQVVISTFPRQITDINMLIQKKLQT